MSVASSIDAIDAGRHFEQHRRELTAYCYRMLGSAHDAEDAVQDAFVRAWRGLAGLEGQAGLRPWLYRIATNVCLDMLRGRTRRALPMDLVPAAVGRAELRRPLSQAAWIEPIPEHLVVPPEGDPAEIAALRESIRLAFIAALQHLLPRQRAVLILRDVLRWKAAEVAALLDTSIDAVHSALRRARAALAAAHPDAVNSALPDGAERELLTRYVDAFERFDIDALVALLREDATLSMPPYALWLRGRDAIRWWLVDAADHCRHTRLVPVDASGSPAVAVYRSGESDATLEPFAIHVLEPAGDRIAAIHAFLEPRLFRTFHIPTEVDPVRR